MARSKRVLIINTGGTMCSIETPNGLAPTAGYLETVFATLPALTHHDLPEFVIQDCPPLIDSSNMDIDKWNQLAKLIASAHHTMDGFIIFHGTDTMAYTASALSFMLCNLSKPVILTGAQLPLSNVRSDALDNAISSLLLSTHPDVHEVCIYFHQQLWRGNRARKLHASRFDAFESPNYPALATIGLNIEVHLTHLLKKPTAPFHLHPLSSHAIATFHLFPGYSLQTLHALLSLPLRALVLETYGIGNAPNHQPEFLSLLEAALARGILIVNMSQCLTGGVMPRYYETGMSLEKIGVVSATDMTPEALYSKLLYACGCTQDPRVLRTIMQTNLCGEMSTELDFRTCPMP